MQLVHFFLVHLKATSFNNLWWSILDPSIVFNYLLFSFKNALKTVNPSKKKYSQSNPLQNLIIMAKP